jgi:hypothetical protein
MSHPAIPAPAASRAAHDAMLRDAQSRFENHRTNVQLWAEVRRARASGDPRQVSTAEQALADYLSVNLAKINGKAYPPRMSLAAVLKEYKAFRRHGSARRCWVPVALATVTVAPLAVFALYSLRQRRLRARLIDTA